MSPIQQPQIKQQREKSCHKQTQNTYTYPASQQLQDCCFKSLPEAQQENPRAPTLTTESTINRHTSKLLFLRLPSSSPTSGPVRHTFFSLSVSLPPSLPVCLLSVCLASPEGKLELREWGGIVFGWCRTDRRTDVQAQRRICAAAAVSSTYTSTCPPARLP